MVGNLAGELPAGASAMAKSKALSIGKTAALGKQVGKMKIEREDARQMI